MEKLELLVKDSPNNVIEVMPENIERAEDIQSSEKITEAQIYSPKLGTYVSAGLGNARGELQRSNTGIGPGSWY